MVFFAIEWEGGIYDKEQTFEPLTKFRKMKHMVMSFLEKQGLELFVDRITQESWAVASPPDSSELSSDDETNLDPSAGLQ